MTQVLYRKWRPRQWEQVIGQEHVIQTLRNSVLSERVAHAYLFAGPRGTGKTTVARLLAKAVNCLHADLAARPCDQCEYCRAVNEGRFLDLIEIDAASNTSVDDVRDLREKVGFLPNQGRYKVYIIDEVHMLSTAAFNALLKTLEEPPAHAIFILATTEIHKIPATVLSRCQRHEFRRIPVSDIVAQLEKIVQEEGLKAEDEALRLVARQATGSLRDAISLLDHLASSDQTITLELAQTLLGTATNQAVLEIIEAMLRRSSAAGLDTIHRTLDAGSDPRQFARQIVDYLRNLLLARMGSLSQVEATAEVRAQMAQHAQGFTIQELLTAIRLFSQAASDSRNVWQPSLPLEMAFVEALDRSQALTGAPPEASEPPGAAILGGRQTQAPEGSALPEEQAGSQPEDGLTLQMIQDRWRQIRSLVRQRSPNTEALLISGKVLGVKEGVLYLGFSEVLKSKMEKSENIECLHAVLQEVFKRQVPVRCIVYTGKSSKIPADIDHDGMVAAALRDLGGEIVDVQ